MICYLIPECKTCIKQEQLLKADPDPSVNIRYVTMEYAKSTPYKYPLWILNRYQYQGILNSYGEIPGTTPKKLVKLSNIFQNQPSILSNFGKKSCFGQSLLGGGNSMSEQNIINNVNKSITDKMYKSAGKAGATLTQHGLKSLKSNKQL